VATTMAVVGQIVVLFEDRETVDRVGLFGLRESGDRGADGCSDWEEDEDCPVGFVGSCDDGGMMSLLI
jgi:hypothetical protein